MNESEFNQHINHTLEVIENAIDDSGVDIDYETTDGILTLYFDNDSRIIINRQTPLQEIWVAAKSGGFHFSYDIANNHWIDTNHKQELFTSLSNLCTEQAGVIVKLER